MTTFRVDNPHTKPVNFWHWLISKVHETDPDVGGVAGRLRRGLFLLVLWRLVLRRLVVLSVIRLVRGAGVGRG
ncbi:hypothetical protein K4H04_25295, partial [Mycobacterium tuberculosis]|nr:hypothetical protein [Mycobacterium tuberculosis]